MNETVGLFAYRFDRSIGATHLVDRTPARLYRKAIWYRANPRNAEAMRRLLARWRPDARFIDIDDVPDWLNAVAGADHIVLLYPDSIGLGFSSIEIAVRRRKRAGAAISVLNGRGRQFLLDGRMSRRLVLHRLLEKTMLGEAAFTLLFLLTTPIVLAVDLARGRS